MKRCSSSTLSPPSSPIISRSKRISTSENNEIGKQSFTDNLAEEGCEENNEDYEEEKLLSTQDIYGKTNNIFKSNARKGVQFSSLASLVTSSRESPGYISAGCHLLDKTLSGGLRRGEVTEVVGESSSGKSQLCLQFCVEAAARGETVLFIVTEGPFPQTRLDQMVTARQNQDVRNKIMIQQVKNVHHLFVVLGSELENVMKSNEKISLVIIDSVAALIRYDADLGTVVERGGLIHKLGQTIIDIANNYNVALVTVNQVTDLVEDKSCSPYSWGRRQVPSLGHAWSQYPHTRLWVTKTKLVLSNTAKVVMLGLVGQIRLRTLQVDKSPRVSNSSVHFYVDSLGCHGVNIID